MTTKRKQELRRFWREGKAREAEREVQQVLDVRSRGGVLTPGQQALLDSYGGGVPDWARGVRVETDERTWRRNERGTRSLVRKHVLVATSNRGH